MVDESNIPTADGRQDIAKLASLPGDAVVARTRPETHALVVTFSRDGEEPEEMFASDGQRAWRNTITLIAKREWLLSGDTLTVRRTHGSPGAAPNCVRWASHRCGGCEPSRGNRFCASQRGLECKNRFRLS